MVGGKEEAMTADEFSNIAMFIKALYPRDDKLFCDRMQVEAWYKMLSDIDYADALHSIEDHAKTNSFPPSIADIRRVRKHMYDGNYIKQALLEQFKDDSKESYQSQA